MVACRCAPALTTYRDEINALFPDRDKASDGCCGDAAHAARRSDHNPLTAGAGEGYAHAYDLDEDLVAGWGDRQLWSVGILLLSDPRTKYVIYEARILYPDGTDNAYTGINAHRHHLHLSIKPTATFNTAPWFVARAFERPDKAAPEPKSFFLEDTVATANHPTQPARVDECIVGTDGAVWHRKGTATAPGDFDEDLGGNDGGPVRSVSCTWTSDGLQFVVDIHGFDNKPYRRVYTEGAEGWGDWFLTHGALIG